MTIDQLRYFLEVVRQKSIHKASEQVHISHQTLSASMKSLESEWGCAFFERSSKGVVLTQEGERLKNYAETILRETAKLENDLANLQNTAAPKLKGALNCLVSVNLSVQILPELMRYFVEQYPLVQLNIKKQDSKQILERFRQGYEGAALLSYYETARRISLPGVKAIPLFDVVDELVVARDHPLAKYQSCSMKNLMKYPLAIYQESSDDDCHIIDMLETFGAPNVKVVSNDISIMESAVIYGGMVTFAPQRAIKHRLIFSDYEQNVKFIKIRDYPHLIVSLLVDKGYQQKNQQLIESLEELLRKVW